MVSKLIVPVLVVLTLAGVAQAAVYPCPSDPGFCYRDVGNDGCFDSGVDEGPINDEIEAQFSFPPEPNPGSIVCPPSVSQLTAGSGSIRLATQTGSSILIYAADIDTAGVFEAVSGDRLLLGGSITGNGTGTLEGEGDVFFEGNLTVPKTGTGSIRTVTLESVAGSVTVGPKSKIRVGKANIMAGGEILFLEKVKLSVANVVSGANADIRVTALGDVEMTSPKIVTANKSSNAVIVIVGANVVLHDKTSIKGLAKFGPKRLEIIASAGDVTADRLVITSDLAVEISAANISIGTAVAGRTPRSTITERLRHIDMTATGAIQIDNLRLTGTQDVTIATTGTTVDILESSFRGRKATPTITISAGPGSTCDLTGTVVKKATLVTNCDTVVGP